MNNKSNINWIVFIALCLVISLQVLIGIIYIYHFIPIQLIDPVTRQQVAPPPGLILERDMFFYSIYLGITATAFLIGLVLFKNNIEERSWLKPACFLLALECFWLSLLLFAAFKLLIYQYPFYNFMPVDNSTWVPPFFIAIALLAGVSKLFWPETIKFLINNEVRCGVQPIPLMYKIVGLGIAMLLTGWMLMTPIMPLNKWMLLTLAYLIALGVLCFCLTQSFALSLAGVWLFMKLNLFNYSLIPIPWVNPQQTAAYQGWEPLFFLLCWWLIHKRHWLLLEILIKLAGIIYACWLVYFLSHTAGLPIYASLRVRQFSSYIIGMMIPIVYMLTLTTLMIRAVVLKKNSQLSLMLMLVAGYGLMAHAIYIHTPTIGGYGRVIMPWVILIIVFIYSMLGKIALYWRRWAAWGITLFTLLSLMTNRLFVIYHHTP